MPASRLAMTTSAFFAISTLLSLTLVVDALLLPGVNSLYTTLEFYIAVAGFFLLYVLLSRLYLETEFMEQASTLLNGATLVKVVVGLSLSLIGSVLVSELVATVLAFVLIFFIVLYCLNYAWQMTATTQTQSIIRSIYLIWFSFRLLQMIVSLVELVHLVDFTILIAFSYSLTAVEDILLAALPMLFDQFPTNNEQTDAISQAEGPAIPARSTN